MQSILNRKAYESNGRKRYHRRRDALFAAGLTARGTKRKREHMNLAGWTAEQKADRQRKRKLEWVARNKKASAGRGSLT